MEEKIIQMLEKLQNDIKNLNDKVDYNTQNLTNKIDDTKNDIKNLNDKVDYNAQNLTNKIDDTKNDIIKQVSQELTTITNVISNELKDIKNDIKSIKENVGYIEDVTARNFYDIDKLKRVK